MYCCYYYLLVCDVFIIHLFDDVFVLTRLTKPCKDQSPLCLEAVLADDVIKHFIFHYCKWFTCHNFLPLCSSLSYCSHCITSITRCQYFLQKKFISYFFNKVCVTINGEWTNVLFRSNYFFSMWSVLRVGNCDVCMQTKKRADSCVRAPTKENV